MNAAVVGPAGRNPSVKALRFEQHPAVPRVQLVGDEHCDMQPTRPKKPHLDLGYGPTTYPSLQYKTDANIEREIMIPSQAYSV